MEAPPRSCVTSEIDAEYVHERYLELEEPARARLAGLWDQFQELVLQQNGMNDIALSLRNRLYAQFSLVADADVTPEQRPGRRRSEGPQKELLAETARVPVDGPNAAADDGPDRGFDDRGFDDDDLDSALFDGEHPCSGSGGMLVELLLVAKDLDGEQLRELIEHARGHMRALRTQQGQVAVGTNVEEKASALSP